MYQIACGFLIVVGLAVNITDRRMFALTALVGASVFLPAPYESAGHFYLFCIAAETAIALAALALRNSAGILVAEACALLVIAHAMGYALDGNPPFSPYRVIVKLLEVSQLVVCVALSPVLAPILRNHDAKTT